MLYRPVFGYNFLSIKRNAFFDIIPYNSQTHLMAFQMAMWYVIWGVLAYVMTLGKSNRKARDWVFTGQIMMLAVEVVIVTTTEEGGLLPSWLFPGMAEYEVL